MSPQNYIPVKEIIALARQGYNDATIVKQLREAGFTSKQINDGFNQAKIKAAAGEMEEEQMEPSIMASGSAQEEETAPTPSSGYYGAETPAESVEGQPALEEYPFEVQFPAVESRPSTEIIEEIAEEIINEKWQDFKAKVGDFGMLRKYFEDKINSLALRTKKLENAGDKIQIMVDEKMRHYDSELKTLKAELQALETAFSKILEPLVTNIRKIERNEIVKEASRLSSKEDKLESKLKARK